MKKRAKTVVAAVTLIGLAVLLWAWLGTEASTANAAAAASAANAASAAQASAAGASAVPGGGTVSTGTGPYSAAGMQSRKEQLALWQGRYDRAEQIYASYRDATRYPYESRPIAEHPDQVRPFAPISEDLKLRNAKGEVVDGIHLRTSQERVFLSGKESVRFTLAAVDDNGNSLPLSVRNASAQSIADTRTPVKNIQTNVSFSDDGMGADDIANDGSYSGRLTPSTQGFQSYSGTIRLLVEVASDSQQGVAQFDVVYTPDVPATWAGVREALEAGSLNFYVKANVLVPGRYVVSGRVDDANGTPFALVQFNDDVATGSREFKLQVFGALVLDKSPVFPLRLRDVDGFLLIPDKFPDRATMARLSGVVYTSASYPKSRFSSAEWNSEERQRYLTEYGHDADVARHQVDDLSSN